MMLSRPRWSLHLFLLSFSYQDYFGESFLLQSPPKASQANRRTRASSAFLLASEQDDAIPGNENEDKDQVSGGRGRRMFLQSTTAAAIGSSSGLLAGDPVLGNVANAEGPKDPSSSPSSPPRVALWGFGNQNQLMARYLAERNIPVVAVVSHHDVGRDYGTVGLGAWGKPLGKKTGVVIVDEADGRKALRDAKADVCFVATRSTVKDLFNTLTSCAEAGTNVITIAEECLDSSTSSPELTKDLDAIFRKNGVSLTGSGFIDGACCEMTMALSSMMQRIDRVEGGLQYNVDDYGTVLAEAHGVGLTQAEFQTNIARNKDQDKSYVYNTNEWLVKAFGLTQKGPTTEVREPTLASVAVKSASINKTIPPGDVTGMVVIATTQTKEGVTIVSKQTGKCYTDDSADVDGVSWGFIGEPAGVRFTLDRPPTPQMTNTAALARLEQIRDAPAGYVGSHDLPPIARYHYKKNSA